MPIAIALGVLLAGCTSNGSDARQTADRGRGVRTVTYDLPADSLPHAEPVAALVPRDPKGRPLLVLLHGRGGSPATWTKQPMPSILESLGDRAPVVVAPHGGEASYFHDRATGAWGTWVAEDVIDDAVDRFGVDPDRVAIAGFSMGGFGALSLAARHPERYCAAGGMEPAIFESAGVTAPGAFDDAADFDRTDVIAAARAGAYADLPLRIDRGTEDDFVAGQDAFIQAISDHGGDVDLIEFPGPHAIDTIRPHLAPAIAWYARALAACERTKERT